ncbi:MAG: L-threonylcarbamoyladenylate synthase [Rikenellaceae bacterium]
MEKLKEQVFKACEVLKAGGLILYPTDTVWGIGCDATNADAVAKVYELKKSADKKSMIVLIENTDRVALSVDGAPSVAWDLIDMSDKPLTLILEGAKGVASNLVPEEGTLGVRVPNHEFCKRLLHRFMKPIVSTSANISGEATPLKFTEISKEIKNGVDMIIDTDMEGVMTRKPSSIISLGRGGEIKILRD